jgi:hypothetical protein
VSEWWWAPCAFTLTDGKTWVGAVRKFRCGGVVPFLLFRPLSLKRARAMRDALLGLFVAAGATVGRKGLDLLTNPSATLILNIAASNLLFGCAMLAGSVAVLVTPGGNLGAFSANSTMEGRPNLLCYLQGSCSCVPPARPTQRRCSPPHLSPRSCVVAAATSSLSSSSSSSPPSPPPLSPSSSSLCVGVSSVEEGREGGREGGRERVG